MTTQHILPSPSAVETFLSSHDLANNKPGIDTEVSCSLKNLQLRNDLSYAFLRKELSFLYQMQVDASGSAYGLEALLRWYHPRHGIIAPLQFLKLAEETGFILPIGLLALETACSVLRKWQQQPTLADLSLTVNIGERHFYHESFMSHLIEVLERYHISRDRLIIEVSELTISRDVAQALAVSHAIQQMGVSISLDDYCMSYISTERLADFPVKQVKVNLALLSMLNQGRSVEQVHSSIFQPHVRIIAEGVETEEQFHWLLENGYRYFQGFLFDVPTTLDKCMKLIAELR